jgi:hypothetical protein
VLLERKIELLRVVRRAKREVLVERDMWRVEGRWVRAERLEREELRRGGVYEGLGLLFEGRGWE